MLVLSRRQGESVIVADHILITVEHIAGARSLIGVARKESPDAKGPDEVIEKRWLASNERIAFGPTTSVEIVDIRGDKVRLGIRAPAGSSVHRWEVYEEIWKQSHNQ